MKVLYIGDVMGEMGIETVEQILPKLKSDKNIDVVIAQAENVTDGRGMNIDDYQRLQKAGVDGFSGGNHTAAQLELLPLLADPAVPVTGPANMQSCPGPGFKYIGEGASRVLMISLLGHIVGKDSAKPTDNSLQKIDEILESQKDEARLATIVNFHGDFSSEKKVIGYYLDGRVSAVIGDHWHIPTADSQILPEGTAHITDVGMCGSLDSSLGVELDVIINRWKSGTPSRNALETKGRKQFNAVLVDVNPQTELAESIEQIQQVI